MPSERNKPFHIDKLPAIAMIAGMAGVVLLCVYALYLMMARKRFLNIQNILLIQSQVHSANAWLYRYDILTYDLYPYNSSYPICPLWTIMPEDLDYIRRYSKITVAEDDLEQQETEELHWLTINEKNKIADFYSRREELRSVTFKNAANLYGKATSKPWNGEPQVQIKDIAEKPAGGDLRR